jgi:hypothetical protein
MLRMAFATRGAAARNARSMGRSGATIGRTSSGSFYSY